MSKSSEEEIIDIEERNHNPSKEALVAMFVWNDEYAKSDKGSMDFYDSLSPARKEQCFAIVDSILKAPSEYTHE